MNVTTMIEHVSYKVKAGVSSEDLLKVNESVNNFLVRQPGFLYRSNSQDNGLYFDIVYWETPEAAQAASTAFMESSEGQALVALTEEGSVTMRHMPALTEAMCCSSDEAVA